MSRTWLALACLLPLAAGAEERIHEFASEIVVMADAWIQVTETITVTAEGKRIRRGIYRDFPTRYRDRLGNAYVVDFEPLAVLRNDLPEDFHAVRVGDGVRVYFGHESRFLEHGRHTYVFRYRASRMLGFFEDHDELYWNVTGFDWAFPIDAARATVRFDFDVPPAELTHEAYTGAFGATGRDYDSHVDASGAVHFRARSPLSPVNGMSIVVGWPKGYVEAPSDLDRLAWLLEDNANLLIALLGLVLLLIYYVPVWKKFGKDPDEGVIVTRYEPPPGYSPASLRYVRQMYYDDKVMTAAVVNLAVKGYLKITSTEGTDGFFGIGAKDPEHSLTKTDPGPNPPPLAPGERELYEALFAENDSVGLAQENHERLGKAKTAHKASLKKDYKERYFRTNVVLNVPAVLIVVLSAFFAFRQGLTLATVLVVLVMVAITAGFALVMKRPTVRGRRLLDEMLGFRDYLDVAEKDEMNLRNPPAKTPELFEAYLPYALALGVDLAWAEKFADVLAKVRGADGGAYRPGWYNGSWSVNNLAGSTSQLSTSLNSAISTSVSPPGSSSGGGGGGFSGGGGGGGGGGGW
ncbi:MAG: DUF2207 domain-containing protein [Woeseiaceae bacterium]|nr:DUF2207 domain-containing protein [Woeseiaceae bacterium]